MKLIFSPEEGQIMQKNKFNSNHSSTLNKTHSVSRISQLGLVTSLLLGLALTPCFAADAPDHAHMNMDMDHSEHAMDMNMDMSHSDHDMDHSMHQHHLNIKPGIFSRSVSDLSLPNVSLVDMNGGDVMLHDVFDSHSPIILNFIFTTCTTICPVQSAAFRQVQEKLGSKVGHVRMVSVSIDPENDTPAKLRDYAKRFSVGSQWKLLTGSLDNSIAVQKAFAVFAGDKMDQKPVTFLKAKGSANSWVRLDGLVDAQDIVKEFDKLDSK